MNIKKIIELREANKWTQKEFADLMGVSQAMVAFIESGKKIPSLALAQSMAQALGCELNEII